MVNQKRFLLVDDDEDDICVFKEVLEDVNPSIDLACAGDGKEALKLLKQEQNKLPDIIFLDLNMPLMGGKECLCELKKDPQLKRIPVIMYTTSSQSKDIEETMLNGAICFITKPTSLRELKNILSSISHNINSDLEKCLRTLSDTSGTFIVC